MAKQTKKPEDANQVAFRIVENTAHHASGVSETETVIKKILPYLRRREYEDDDFRFEYPTQLGDTFARGFVDMLAMCGKSKPSFLIEAKKTTKRLMQQDIEQAITYGKSIGVFFVVLTNGNDWLCFNTANGEQIKWNGTSSQKIPLKSQLGAVIRNMASDRNTTIIRLDGDTSLPFRPGLTRRKMNELFAQCHTIIRKVEKEEDDIFADFSKILFLKLLEEKDDSSDFSLPYSYRFHQLAALPESESDQVKTAIEAMVNAIRKDKAYGDVLSDAIRLKNGATFQQIVRVLANVSFQDSGIDSKGAAFEYFVRATLKGKKLGQYFTPRPLVRLMAAIIGDEKIVNGALSASPMKVLDPACGTGGFLIFLMQDSLNKLRERYDQKKITRGTYDAATTRIITSTVWGADANRGVAAAAKMNMIVAGDGHSNIRAEDSLKENAQNWNIANPDCDIIITNPPFGTSESLSLNTHDKNAYPIHGAKGQHLFLQKMVLASKPHGEICTVIDEGVLNTETVGALRRWLFEKCHVLAVIRLPKETFAPNKINVRSSVLYLRRREHDDIDGEDNYAISFCSLDSLGYDGEGERQRGFDDARLIDEVVQSLLDHRLGNERHGYHWHAFDVDSRTVLGDGTCRLDYKYWSPAVRQRSDAMRTHGSPTITGLLTARRGKSPSADTYVDQQDGYALVVKAGNVSKYGDLIARGDYIERNIYDEIPTAHIKEGDILLASTGDGTLGKCCVYRSDAPAVADQHVTIIRGDQNKIWPEYLCDYLRAGFGARQIERLYTGSTGQIELTLRHVNDIVLDLSLTIAEQKHVSKELRKQENDYLAVVEQAESSLREARRQFFGDMDVTL